MLRGHVIHDQIHFELNKGRFLTLIKKWKIIAAHKVYQKTFGKTYVLRFFTHIFTNKASVYSSSDIPTFIVWKLHVYKVEQTEKGPSGDRNTKYT